jgi:hypothetical protein
MIIVAHPSVSPIDPPIIAPTICLWRGQYNTKGRRKPEFTTSHVPALYIKEKQVAGA